MECVLHWQLLLEEFGPEIHYIKREENDAVDALSHLPKTDINVTEHYITHKVLAERYCVDKLDSDTFLH